MNVRSVYVCDRKGKCKAIVMRGYYVNEMRVMQKAYNVGWMIICVP